jgi:ubiquinone/menaquinone biosynthesis C-methylase UbiE
MRSKCLTKHKTKEGRFKCLAEYRTNEVLKRIRILGNCSNRSFYSYTQEEIEKIFQEIEKSLQKTKAKFTFSKKKKFTL